MSAEEPRGQPHTFGADELGALVESSDDAIVTQTLDAVITSWNPGAERIYGYAAAEMIGRSLALLVPPDRATELPRIMVRLRHGERTGHFETIHLRKDRTRIRVSVSFSPIRSNGGPLTGAVFIARDVTEQKRGEEERKKLLEREQAALAEARSALALRDQFLSFAAHELRTPLTSLRGNIQLAQRRLERGATSEAIIEAVGRADSQVDRLRRLVDDLLDVSRIGSGRLSIDVETVALQPLVKRMVDMERDIEPLRAIELSLPEASILLDVDPGRLEQVLINLLHNARKYSPPDKSVSVRVDRGTEHVRIAVQDQGIGIPPEDVPHIFDRFHRASNVDPRRVSGLGLGLYIARAIVEAHGGRLRLESAPGEGSTFTVILPIARVSLPAFGEPNFAGLSRP